jgi:hypothetical protein
LFRILSLTRVEAGSKPRRQALNPFTDRGWIEAGKLESTPGINWCDRLKDQQDRADKLDRIQLRQEMERGQTIAALGGDGVSETPSKTFSTALVTLRLSQ